MNVSKFSSPRKLALAAALASVGLMGATSAHATAAASATVTNITVTLSDLDGGSTSNVGATIFASFCPVTGCVLTGVGSTSTGGLGTLSYSGTWSDLVSSPFTFSVGANTSISFDVSFSLTSSTTLAGESATMQLYASASGLNGKGLNQLSQDVADVSSFNGIVNSGSSLTSTLNVVFNNGSTNASSNDTFLLRETTAGVTVSPVPEPESYAMFLAGLAAMGAVARRRRVK